MTETVEEFRLRARTWIEANLRRLEPGEEQGFHIRGLDEERELASVAHDRALQRKLFDAGFAGLCFPVEYGGQGLTIDYQRAFNDEIAPFEFPARFQAPTMSPCAAVLLDFGTEEQKQAHIPAILRGDELWMQLLSEPGGGSDVASATTTATREGDDWILNGSKVWTTGAWWSDWGLCLARTNWDVPKHRGLTVFILPLHQDGVDVHRIEMLNGSKEFCQEFLTDVRVPDSDRIGEVDAGWTVGTRWMFHERMLYNSPLVTVPKGAGHGGVDTGTMVEIARGVGRLHDTRTQDLIGEARMLELVKDHMTTRIGASMRAGKLNDQAAAVARLFAGVSTSRLVEIGYEVAGSAAAAWLPEDGAATHAGTDYLSRQTSQIGGGTTEMARNVVSERVLGMPRERSLDRNVPFRDVPRGGRS